VMDMSTVDKIEAKRTKPGTGMKRRWVILCINPLYLNIVSFGVDVAEDFKKK
nr:hypothetical protein [Tanacetum cinerariifolium]